MRGFGVSGSDAYCLLSYGFLILNMDSPAAIGLCALFGKPCYLAAS